MKVLSLSLSLFQSIYLSLCVCLDFTSSFDWLKIVLVSLKNIKPEETVEDLLIERGYLLNCF